jgi:hypothetical protein
MSYGFTRQASEDDTMDVNLVTKGEKSFLEGPSATPLLRSTDDVIDLIGSCFEHGTHSVLLYAENLTERFFDLSSGEAGAILQKFRNYHIKAAVVLPEGGVHQSDRFREMAAEESKGNDLRVFQDRDSAEAWLLRD